MSYEISLQAQLNTTGPDLASRLIQIEKDAKTLLTYTAGHFPFYTPHDFQHSENVVEILNIIIPDKIKSTIPPHEIFFLILAAWLHDWGMVCEEGENPEEVRNNHHIRSAQNIEKMHKDLGITEHEATIIGLIAKGHREVDLYDTEYDDRSFSIGKKIRPRFLAALLRVADECDVTHNRTPEVIYHTINPTGKSEEEFKKHLSISGIGQIDEKHKLYINAVTKDPKGARVMREVASKIQQELDSVKSILKNEKIPLDYVELRLETRGFIDKPIGFEVEKSKIVELLVGNNLYAKNDAAIRELIQNSIDSCLLREKIDSNPEHEIIITKDTNTISIEDNGTGMGFTEAKEFLSNIGSSFYSSEALQDCLNGNQFCPISKYGIGILSTFLISDSISIETYKLGCVPCLFSIKSVHDEWKYEKSMRDRQGTKITLVLNDEGKKIQLEETLKRYFLCPDIAFKYQDTHTEIKRFNPIWDFQEIKSRFSDYGDQNELDTSEQLLEICTDEYDCIFGRMRGWSDHITIFNHVVFVEKVDLPTLGRGHCLCINIKKDIIDLNISRESVIRNNKWDLFIEKIFDKIITHIHNNKGHDEISFISELNSILEGTYYIYGDVDGFITQNPFLKSFSNHAIFPYIENDTVNYIKIKDLKDKTNFFIYNGCTDDFMSELNLIKNLNKNNFVFDPYNLPQIMLEKDTVDWLTTILFPEKIKNYNKIDFNQIIIKSAQKASSDELDFLPPNIKLVTFPSNIRPIVAINIPANYQENLVSITNNRPVDALWNNMLNDERTKQTLSILKKSPENLNRIEALTAYVDRNDHLVCEIIKNKKQIHENKDMASIIKKYFKYLSYLPIALSDLSGSIVFFELIDIIEEHICKELTTQRPAPLLERMLPNGQLYYNYYTKHGFY